MHRRNPNQFLYLPKISKIAERLMQISETIDRQQRARRHCNGHVHGLLDVDLVHWWASRGEKVAFEVLKGALQRSGIACSDTSIAGGASMMQCLDARLAVATSRLGRSQRDMGRGNGLIKTRWRI